MKSGNEMGGDFQNWKWKKKLQLEIFLIKNSKQPDPCMQYPNNTACPDATNQTTPDLDTISVTTTISHTSSCRVLFSIIIPLILETLLILALICRLTSFFFFSRYNKTCDAFPLNVTDKTLDRKTVAALATSCYLLEESFIGTC